MWLPTPLFLLADRSKDIAAQYEQDNAKPRKLGVTWKNLTVKGIGADSAFNENIFSQLNIVQLAQGANRPKSLKTIVENSHGCVRPGEMLLVLGRPGAGCTSLLKVTRPLSLR